MNALDDEETPGLAGERTDMAWSRSGLALLVAVGAVLRLVFLPDDADAPTIVFALVAAGAIAWFVAMLHARTISRHTIEGRPIADPARLRSLAYGTTAFALGALVLAAVQG
ncbi:MAG TPA: DUF202 domain-containing protein [Acidimicrobiia bacterium]|nr:DUF202 domain-containing protein [Acidimicrobiia bacterium]